MIYVCIPVHNEVRTAGLVLWKVRQVFTAFPREYQLLVCDDASTDGTREMLASYAKVLPMTVITHRERRGYARTLEELLQQALQRTDRPRRDCAIILHADFSHSPDDMEAMVRRIESGTDVVVAEYRPEAEPGPSSERLARAWVPRLLRVPGVRDAVSGFVAVRLVVWRQVQRRDGAPLLATDGWCANAELVARLAGHARSVETIPAASRYATARRPSRTSPWRRLIDAWKARPVIRAARVTAALLLLAAMPLRGDPQRDSAALKAPPAAKAVPFPTGERLVYGARFGVFSVGEAVMEVAGLDTIRGDPAVHFRFHIEGGALWYHLDQTLESWVGQSDFRSRRFWNQTEEKGKSWSHKFEIFPDSGFFREAGRDSTFPTVPDPLDDAAFLYWIRTTRLEPGQRYEYRRYFRPERNPVIVEVIGRERINVAGRRWDAIVLSPKIPNGGGIFAERADARMWLSDDSARIMLALQSKFSFGVVTLKLKEFSVPERS